MRTTIDIPDDLYRKIKVLASQRGTSVRQLVMDGLGMVVRPIPAPRKKRFEIPVIPSTRTDKLNLTNDNLYDYIDFP